MSSRTLIPSQTTVSIHVLPSRHEADPGETSVSQRRVSFLRHMNGLWKGLAPRSKKQSTSDRVLPQASPPSEPEPTPVSEHASTPPNLTFSPPSPTIQTPVSLPCDDADASWPWITVTGTGAEDVSVRPAQSLYRASPKPFPETTRSKSRVSVSENSGLSCMATSSPVVAPSGSIPDAATRLQDFRSLIVEMRASLLDRDCETAVDAGGRDEEEVERLLQLLEDVMRKVRELAERDTGLGVPLIKIHPAP